jgi:hypothetical protein
VVRRRGTHHASGAQRITLRGLDLDDLGAGVDQEFAGIGSGNTG